MNIILPKVILMSPSHWKTMFPLTCKPQADHVYHFMTMFLFSIVKVFYDFVVMIQFRMKMDLSNNAVLSVIFI